MQFDFDEVVNRRGTNSAKWDAGTMLIKMGITERFDEDTLPLFTADMDFHCPPSVKEEIQKVVDFNLYGYTAVHRCYRLDEAATRLGGEARGNSIRGWHRYRHPACFIGFFQAWRRHTH